MRNPVDRLTAGLPHAARVVVDWVVTLAVAVGIVLAVKAWVVNPYRIPTSSMEPTLHCAQPAEGCLATASDRVLANRFIFRFRDPERGQVVVFRTPPEAARLCNGASGTFVKRIVGLPNETIEDRGGFLYADGRRLDEPYAHGRDGTHSGKRWVLGPDEYLMVGDNRNNSCDSRVWGPVPRANLIGPVFATYWPPDRLALGA
jgi:signal peptidase I